MADIFLSYSRKDRQRAKLVAEALQQQRWSVFWDYKIAAGTNWGDLVDKELNTTKCVVVLWSTNAVTSRWVKTEARRGIEREILVPAILEVCEIPVEFRYHHSAELSAWNGDVADHELQVLFDGVRSLVAESLAQPVAAAIPIVEVPSTSAIPKSRSQERSTTPVAPRDYNKIAVLAPVRAWSRPVLVVAGAIVITALVGSALFGPINIWLQSLLSEPEPVASQPVAPQTVVEPQKLRLEMNDRKEPTLLIDGTNDKLSMDQFLAEITTKLLPIDKNFLADIKVRFLDEDRKLGLFLTRGSLSSADFEIVGSSGVTVGWIDVAPVGHLRVITQQGGKGWITYQRYSDGSYRRGSRISP